MAEIEIDKIGSLGDGMGQLAGQTVFVPTTIHGERVKASGDAPHLTLDEVLTPSEDRVEPLCQHFGTCGGCALQHVKPSTVLQWKQEEVAAHFKRAKIKTKIEPCIATPPHSRRRVTFTARRENSTIKLGFLMRASVDLVDIQHCPILVPEIESQTDLFRTLAATLLRGRESIQIAINACDNGLDFNFILENQPSEAMTAAFVRAFARTPFLRASLNGDIIADKEKPLVQLGPAQIALPPAAFLQAVSHAEEAMSKLVCAHLKGRKKIADLFCGSGTFSLPLAQHARVHGVEAQQSALTALNAANGTHGLKSITTEQRDLYELPLSVQELKPFDGICLDPPRAGASEQIEQIAKANSIRSLAYVSCNPATLARDSAVLIKAGYVLEKVVPVDQFVFSPHIEAIALFSKKQEKSTRSIFR